MKKLTAIVLALVMVLALCACGGNNDKKDEKDGETAKIKAGLICLHDENSGYDANFINAFKAACEATGVDYEIKTNIEENQAAYDAAAELADNKCNVIFADSYGHQPYILQAAKEFTNVQFTSCTGDTALSDGVSNFHNAFAKIFQGRYVAGVAAGLKLNEMIANKEITAEQAVIGYVGAMPYAEVKSGYTSFLLGAQSVCPSATMKVVFTGSWYDETREMESAQSLIKKGCVLISQHADSMGAPNACETAKVPNVSYNGSTQEACPNTYIISSRIDWTPYFTYAIKAVQKGENYDTDWCGDLSTGGVALTEINEKVAAKGTADKLTQVENGIKDGSIKVFATDTWTVGGKALETYENEFFKGHECIKDGVFAESTDRSAPYFDIDIDGIEILQ